MNLREKIIRSSFLAGACHIGSALSVVEIVEAVYEVKKSKDIFIFAKASGVSVLYCYLHPIEKAAKYLKAYPLPSREVPGVNAGWSGGSLGMGLSVAAGMAYADRKRKVYCLISDGELQEGQTWEAIMFVGYHKLNNLVLIVDDNRMQSLGAIKDVIDLDPKINKFIEFRWSALNIDGHDKGMLVDCLKMETEKPKVIIANTVKGKGIKEFENDYRWHYKNLTQDRFTQALLELNTENSKK